MLISDITRKFSVTKPKPLPARLDRTSMLLGHLSLLHLLYTPFLCWSSVTTSLLIPACHFCLIFYLLGWSFPEFGGLLTISSSSRPPLLFKVIVHDILPSRALKRSAFLKCSALVLLFSPLLSPLRILTSILSQSLQPRLS